MKKPEIILRLLRIPLDLVSVVGAFLLAYFWRLNPDMIPFVSLESPLLLPFQDFLWFSIQAAILVVCLFVWESLYSLRKSYSFRKEIRRIIMMTGASFTIIILYFFLVGVQFFSRFILGTSFVLVVLFMVSHRLILRIIQYFMWKKGVGRRRVLFLGSGKILNDLIAFWGNNPAFDLVGVLADVGVDGLVILGKPKDLEKIIGRYSVDEVVQISHLSYSENYVEICQLNHIEYRFVPNMLEVQRTNTEVDFVRNIPMITLKSSAVDWRARVIKRFLDVFLSFLAFIFLSPIFLIISVVIKLSDGGSVFYRSKRVSKNKIFSMWKFRTMVMNADHLKKDLSEKNRRDGPLFKIENDPRITKLGRFLRKTSLDEFPQLWNVFRGDLSLVGPRAHLPEEVAQYEKHHKKVLIIKSGVTGLAQVSGRSKLDFEKEVKLDVYYLENWSLWMDIKIILKTFGVLFQGE